MNRFTKSILDGCEDETLPEHKQVLQDLLDKDDLSPCEEKVLDAVNVRLQILQKESSDEVQSL